MVFFNQEIFVLYHSIRHFICYKHFEVHASQILSTQYACVQDALFVLQFLSQSGVASYYFEFFNLKNAFKSRDVIPNAYVSDILFIVV